MPGSKISCNSFYMYMLAVRQREEAQGRKFPRGLDDVVPLASYEWYHLPAETKALYKEKAREYKSSLQFRAKKRMIRNRPRKTKVKQKNNSSSDESFIDDEDVIFYDPEDEVKFHRRREHDRNSLKAALTWNLGGDYLAKKVIVESFFVVSVQNYYETPNHDYMPAEIGLVEFSLMKGIINQYNVILKPINIPDLSRKLVMKRANETHQILPECLPKESRNDYRAVVEEIKSFYAGKQTNQFRVFSLTKQFNSVQGAMKKLRDKTGSKSLIPAEKISNVEDLFVLLCAFKGVSPQQTDLMGFDELLMETNWDYEPHTLCTYHGWRQSKYCALAIARKICYYLFERLKDVYGLHLTSHHIPPLPLKAKYRYPKKIQDELKLNENDDEDDDDDDDDFGSLQDQYDSQCYPSVNSPPSKMGPPRRYDDDQRRVCSEFEFDEEHSFDRFFKRAANNCSSVAKKNDANDIPRAFMNTGAVRCSWKDANGQQNPRFAPPFAYRIQETSQLKPFPKTTDEKLTLTPSPTPTEMCNPMINNYSITSDYFALHSIRPPFGRPKMNASSNLALLDTKANCSVASNDLLTSKMSPIKFPPPPPPVRYSSSTSVANLLKAPGVNPFPVPLMYQNVNSPESYPNPIYFDQFPPAPDIPNFEEIRRPTTKSLCAQLMEEKRARMASVTQFS